MCHQLFSSWTYRTQDRCNRELKRILLAAWHPDRVWELDDPANGEDDEEEVPSHQVYISVFTNDYIGFLGIGFREVR